MKRVLWLPTLVLLVSLPAEAEDFFKPNHYVQTTVYGQAREDLHAGDQFPLNTYFSSRYGEKNWLWETNFSLLADARREKADFDLYETNVLARFLDKKLKIRAGRHFFTPGFDTVLLDGLKADWSFSPRLGLVFSAGVPRYAEISDFQDDSGFLSSAQILWNTPGNVSGNTAVVYRKTGFDKSDWNETERLSVANYFVYDWKGADVFRFYSGVEYLVAAELLGQVTSGINWHPQKSFTVNAEFNWFDENRDEIKDTLTAIHTEGRILQGRLGTRHRLHRDLDLVTAYTFSRFKDPSSLMGNSHQLEAGFDYFLWPARLNVAARYGWIDGYGGRAHLGSLGVTRRIAKKGTVTLDTHFADFKKRTNDNGKAFSTDLWGGWEIAKGWTVGANLQFLKNNDMKKELRGGFTLRWNFGKPLGYPRTMKGVLPL